MLSAKNSIRNLDFSKSEEIAYQLSELQHHLKNVHQSMEDLFFHLNKALHHAELLQALKEQEG